MKTRTDGNTNTSLCKSEKGEASSQSVSVAGSRGKEEIEQEKKNIDTINMTNDSHDMIYASHRRVMLRATILC